MNTFPNFSAAVFAQHLFDGGHKTAGTVGWADGGFVGYTMDMARYAHDIARYVTRFRDRDWPGVYEYEVVFYLGQWLAENRNTYVENDREFKEELVRRTEDFFEQV